MKQVKSIGLSLVVITALGLTGCGSSSSDTSTENSDTTQKDTVTPVITKSGTFIDAPVKGLHYITVSQDAYTDENGTFKYVDGETIEFKIGNLSLGTVTAGDEISPYTMGDSSLTDPSDKTKNIALLLQNFDANKSDTDTLDLSKLKDYNFTDINLSADTTDVETEVTNLLNSNDFQLYIDESNTTLIDSNSVTSTMKDYFTLQQIKEDKKFTTEYLNGKSLFVFFKKADTYSIFELSFTDKTMNFQKESYPNTELLSPSKTPNIDYTISSDGILQWEDEDGKQQINIISVTDVGFIVPKETDVEKGIKQNETMILYFTKADVEQAITQKIEDEVTATGTFVDAPVKGLHYITASQDAYTDENGSFKYIVGETIEFKLGNLSLGTVEASGFLSPYTMGESDLANPSDKTKNIALLLQNFDTNKSDTTLLDLSTLKDTDFSEYNLSDSTDNLEAKLNNDVTTGTFGSILNSTTNLLDSAKVTDTMKTFIENKLDAQDNNISSIINKEFANIRCSELLGCYSHGIMKFTDTTFHIEDDYHSSIDDALYTQLDNGVIQIEWNSGDIEYMKIINITANTLSMTGGDTFEEAQSAIDNRIFVIPSIKDTLIENKNKQIPNHLSKTLVTDFSELENQTLYQMDYWNEAPHDINITIDSNSSIISGYAFSSQSHYDVESFDNGVIHLTGYNSGDNEQYDRREAVYKYNLAEHDISMKEFSNRLIFDNNKFPDNINEKIIHFTTGSSMYCHILWSECWVNKNAIDEMKAQLAE